MYVQPTHRKDMVEKIQAIHSEGMQRLREYYPSVAEKVILDKVDSLILVLSEAMRSTAGRANMKWVGDTYKHYTIKINARLHAINPGELAPTYLHELAHIAANALTNRHQAHGPGWQHVMRVLGLPAERLHTMDTSALVKTPAKHVYKCGGCSREYKLSTRKHNKQQNWTLQGHRGYFCRCGKDIEFTGFKTNG